SSLRACYAAAYFFFFSGSVAPRDLHSFPTRRSSDLDRVVGSGEELCDRLAPDLIALVFERVDLDPVGLEVLQALEVLEHLEDLRSEEHTSELQSPCNLVCRLLLEKKKKKKNHTCTV